MSIQLQKPKSTPLDVIPNPIILFTGIDASRAVAKAPIVVMPDYHNAAAVLAYADANLLMQKSALLIVTHHTKSLRTGKMRMMGSWQIQVPIIPTTERHIFEVQWPTDDPCPVEDNSTVEIKQRPKNDTQKNGNSTNQLGSPALHSAS